MDGVIKFIEESENMPSLCTTDPTCDAVILDKDNLFDNEINKDVQLKSSNKKRPTSDDSFYLKVVHKRFKIEQRLNKIKQSLDDHITTLIL